MNWKGRRRSSNVEYKQSGKGQKLAIGGGIGAIVISGLMLFLSGGDMSSILRFLLSSQDVNTTMVNSANVIPGEQEKEFIEYIEVVLGDTEDIWTEEFTKIGQTYRKPKVTVFNGGSIQSACGLASSATGPFYCSADERIYIDLNFFTEMEQKYAKGDFPMAYVIAHEVGHHVQHLLGTLKQVHEKRGRISEKEYNQFTVRLELQADFYAGFWANKAHQKFGILEDGDIDEALNAATAIGDDRLQKQARGYVVPDSFTHGTSAQRCRWFKKGYQANSITDGNTFNLTYNSL